jgi:hypothetical protein
MSDVVILDCGCSYSNVDDTFLFEPHAEDCRYYLFVLAESERQDKPITILDVR